MSSAGGSVAMFLVIALLSVAASGDEPKSDQPNKSKAESPQFTVPTAPDRIVRYQKNHKRHNGAMLQITSDVVPTNPVGPVLRVRWAIDYEGPRTPLIIHAPSLERPTSETKLSVIYYDLDGIAQNAIFRSGVHDGPWFPAETDFVTAKTDKPATGTIDVRISEIEKQIGWKLQAGNSVYVVLDHAPTWRGDRLAGDPMMKKGLDAWTGSLNSNPVKVTIPDKTRK